MSNQRGAVSIFMVIFTSLLVVVVTTGFVQIMLRNQQQASNNDLSQSAYDSAMAGVEDAKRALVRLKECDQAPSPKPGDCGTLRTALVDNGDNCQTLQVAGVDFSPATNEVTVGAPELNQAYTCVKLTVKTKSYEGALKDQLPNVIPLIPDGNSNDITHVKVSWLISDNLPVGCGNTVAVPPSVDLQTYASWPSCAPPMMRAQLIQFDGNNPIDLEAFSAPGSRNATTLFLYPSNISANPSFTDDGRRSAGSRNAPRQVRCEPNFDSTIYACSATIALPPPTGQREAYLQLAGIYNKSATNYKVELCRSSPCTPGNVIDFDNVQPIIDSTGRASDLFRRVRARVTVTGSGTPEQFPEAALLIDGNVCKDFRITNAAGDYAPDTDLVYCEPNSP
ncbi:MAG: hypothetical protein V4678_03775 [Patescibacteria group bacterium]